MPVLATMATIALLRGGGNSPGPFFDPVKLKEMLQDGLGDDAEGMLESSMKIVDSLASQLERYRTRVDESFDAYEEGLENPEVDVADLISRLEPLDRERMDVLKSVIDYRRKLIGVLDDPSWQAVFD